ncbi:hypothetical protein [Pararhizobium sp.]|uniref:hypothetical protein n=1 Tax=Pararhizobium sp. TaxID=1977563 RepID=UPI00271967DE|nr:hypothetical protein [Pararhizobium sp.]MDO9415867.1 hypothetical protein [Pararhizobium sp.]
MRTFILTAFVAATAAVSFAAPSSAGGYGSNGYEYSQDYSYQPVCVIKKIHSYDRYGNPKVKKVRICK